MAERGFPAILDATREFVTLGRAAAAPPGRAPGAMASAAGDDPLRSIDWGSALATDMVEVFFAPAGATVEGVRSEGWTTYEIGQAMRVLSDIAAFTDLSFRAVDRPGDAEFRMVTIRDEQEGFLGLMVPPGEEFAGVGVINLDGFGWKRGPGGALDRGGLGYATLAHEFGHGLGLAQPHDEGGSSTIMRGVTGPFDSYGAGNLNQGVYTTMSYNAGWPLGPFETRAPFPEEYGLQGGMMALDIAVLQAKYGADEGHARGPDSYVLPAANAPGAFFEAIWDAGGRDRIVNDSGLRALIDLRPATLRQEIGGGGFPSFAEKVNGGFTIAAGVTIEVARGGPAQDFLIGNAAANRLIGRGGDDLLFGLGGDDALIAGAGADTLLGAAGDDRLRGQAGGDVVRGQAGDDALVGGAGADTARGGGGADSLVGGGGADLLRGGAGGDRLEGGRGDDDLGGGGGADTLKGRAGADRLGGGGGDDRLEGGPGDDVLAGGAGADRFLFRPGDGADRITDFDAARDLLQLRGGAAEEVTLTPVAGGTAVAWLGVEIIVAHGAEAPLTLDDFLF